jgi:hypothetical protein
MASGFDGELDNFQKPELSSLVKLVRVHHGSVLCAYRSLLSIEYGRYSAAIISYAPSDSLIDKQDMTAQEFTLSDTPGKRKAYIASFIFYIINDVDWRKQTDWLDNSAS